jgi:urea transport system permease protein
VRFRLFSDDPAVRRESLQAIERDPEPAHLPLLREAIAAETNGGLRTLMERRERILSVDFAESVEDRVTAIESLSGDLSLEARAAINPLLATERVIVREVPEGANVARRLVPGADISYAQAYGMLAEEGHVAPLATAAERDAALVENIVDGAVAGMPVATLDTRAARNEAYSRLAAAGLVPIGGVPADELDRIVDEYLFLDVYSEPPEITAAALGTLNSIEATLTLNQAGDIVLDALSLASIYFLAAIGLAITFGVMGVINMAHGEFIMMGAYTGYVVQQFIPNYTASLVVALPLAFAVTFLAGVILERFVIRWLYHRPLETLLATFGVSIALQQLAKNIFGTQARPLTAPEWLDGALAINDVLAISYIRIAIFVLALAFFAILLFILNRTRLGLEVRAVRQNPRMAESMGIDRERVNMLTFGLGSGIAGVAGIAIGLFAQVTSELGQNYIVQSFMTVVVGGVGNIFGTLAGATLIGFLQKFIEALNPGNTLAAQTYMVLFIIIFIQFRPRGIVALRGRAAEA